MKHKPLSKTWITTAKALETLGLSEYSWKTLMNYWRQSGAIERRKLSPKNVQWGLESIELFMQSKVLGG